MNFSEIKPRIHAYLGFGGVGIDARTDEIAEECLASLASDARFRYAYKTFSVLPAFLCGEPYAEFLRGSTEAILCVTTLGAEVDRRIKILGRTDVTKSVIYDACASAYLEQLADEYEERFGEDRTYRFCPGYGGSDIADIKYIFELLRPEVSAGVTLTAAGYMLPSKSMAGIIGIGKRAEKRCGDCMLAAHCEYRKEGGRCYNAAK